jgi:hypothetical protein
MAGVLLAAASAIPRGQQDPSTEICRHVRADGGQSTQFDAGSLAESYDRFKREFGRKLDVAIEKSKRLVDSPVDVGLPFCRFPRTMSRSWHRLFR